MSSARDFYSYASDNGTSYQVGLSDDNATAGSFGSPITEGSQPSYQVGWKMRHVCAVNSAGKRTTCPIASSGDTKYMSGGTLSKNGSSVIGGRIGERMTSKK